MEHRKHHIVDIVFVLSLFCAFAVMALFVVVLGAQVYKNISVNMTANYNTRTSISYLTEKVRQGDADGNVDIGDVDGSQALVITQDLGEKGIYETWIFVHEGQLSEVFVQQGSDISPSTAQSIMELEEMELSYVNDGLIDIAVVDADGESYNSMVGVKSESVV